MINQYKIRSCKDIIDNFCYQFVRKRYQLEQMQMENASQPVQFVKFDEIV